MEDYSVGYLSHMTAAEVAVVVVEAAAAEIVVVVVVGGTPDERVYYFWKGVDYSSAAAGFAVCCRAEGEKRPVRLGYRRLEDFE